MIFTQREVLEGLSDYLLRMQSWCDHEGYDDTGVAAVSHGKIGRIRDVVNAVANPVTPGNVALERPVDEFLNERIRPTPDEVEAFDQHKRERNRVFLVHTESGEYSDWTYKVHGIFSSHEAAERYIERQVIFATHDDYSWCYKSWEEPGEDAVPVHPTSKDGVLYEYRGPDGGQLYYCGGEDDPSFYITEYTLDSGVETE